MEQERISRVIQQDYRISRTTSAVKIEVLNYHAEPLTLSREELWELGLDLVEDVEACSSRDDA